MKQVLASSAPFLSGAPRGTRRILIDVLIALSPCLIAASIFFGWHVLVNAAVCMAACYGAEYVYNRLILKKKKLPDFSCLITGAVLALILPAKAVFSGWDFNFYADGFRTGGGADNILFSFDIILGCIIGSVFAVALVKMLFGGQGKNFLNPAAAAHVFLLLCFAFTALNTTGFGFTASNGAFLDGDKGTGDTGLFLAMFIGNQASLTAGTTSAIAILAGCIYLCVRKIIDFKIPLIGIGCFLLFTLLFDGMIAQSLLMRPDTPAKLFNNLAANLMAGSFLFCLVFMANDYTTAPVTFTNKVIYIAGFAFFTVLLRSFSAQGEGAIFALLLMNVLTPLLDRYVVPKPFGYTKPEKRLKAAKKLLSEPTVQEETA
ncbi:MAG: RnfABCDGE type electron transport complex subunit D [Firmicutes bacterium]|nr:RnfABCDGE type electron transport complex subunit D [Bacillota bacterium]